jgi:hypothetical protein
VVFIVFLVLVVILSYCVCPGAVCLARHGLHSCWPAVKSGESGPETVQHRALMELGLIRFVFADGEAILGA